MPIYETLATDKLTVVLDIGTVYTKFGFTGEFAPRYIIKSEIYCRKSNKNRRLCDYESPQHLYDTLVQFMHTIFTKYALLSPKDRPVAVVESMLCPTLFRDTLAKVLFCHFEVSMMLVLPSHLVSIVSLAIETALVVDMGYKEAVAIPICHGMPIIQAWQALPIGSEAIHSNIKAMLTSSNTGIHNFPEYIFEDIKVRCCFVTKQSRAEKLAVAKPEITPCPEVRYPVGLNESIVVSGKVRERAFEIMYDEDSDHLCLSTMILDAIMQVNIDLRHKLAENIVVIGGTAMVPGFKARLKEELIKQLQCERYNVLNIREFKFHVLPCKENYAAWHGGAMYGATEFLSMKAITKENYFKENRLPDWIQIIESNRHRS